MNKYTQIFVQQLCPTSAQEQTEKINSRAYNIYLSFNLAHPAPYICMYIVYMYIAYIGA